MPTRRTFLSGAGLLVAAPFQVRSADAAGVVRAVVAADGSGDFQTVQRAVDHALDHPPRDVGRVILEIRPGVYRERIKVPRDKARLTLVGQDAASTTISGSMSAIAAGGTFFSPIVEVNADGFEARNITFENTFGVGSQAVAISIQLPLQRVAGHALRGVGAAVLPRLHHRRALGLRFRGCGGGVRPL